MAYQLSFHDKAHLKQPKLNYQDKNSTVKKNNVFTADLCPEPQESNYIYSRYVQHMFKEALLNITE